MKGLALGQVCRSCRSAIHHASSGAFTRVSRGFVSSIPVVTVHPGNDINSLKITKENTVNATIKHSNVTDIKYDITAATPSQLPLSFVNNFSGGSINAYVTGLDSNNKLVMLRSDGTFHYPDSNSSTPTKVQEDCAIPLGIMGSKTNITIPGYISAARVWFAEGQLEFFTVETESGTSLVEPSAVNVQDPSSAVNWGFVELTNIADYGLYANISYVDFLGLILGMELLAGDGSTQGAKGLQLNAVQSVCNDLATQSALDGAPWGDLCQVDADGKMLRVLAPTDFMSTNTSAFAEYWDVYVDQVWSTYSNQQLIIDTQNTPGNVTCQVQDAQLQCTGDNRSYSKPTAADIFGCNTGPFAVLQGDNLVHQAVVPRLCAAFHRSTLLLPGGNVQPGVDASHYYTTSPTNYYSKLIHTYELDGKGYAFAYDDVNPDGGVNQSGVVADANPQLLTIYVGGNTGGSGGW